MKNSLKCNTKLTPKESKFPKQDLCLKWLLFCFVPLSSNPLYKNVTDKINNKWLGFPEHNWAQSIYRRGRLTPCQDSTRHPEGWQGMQQEGPFSVWGLDKKHERACGTPFPMPAPDLPKLALQLHLPFFSPPIPPLQSSKEDRWIWINIYKSREVFLVKGVGGRAFFHPLSHPTYFQGTTQPQQCQETCWQLVIGGELGPLPKTLNYQWAQIAKLWLRLWQEGWSDT